MNVIGIKSLAPMRWLTSMLVRSGVVASDIACSTLTTTTTAVKLVGLATSTLGLTALLVVLAKRIFARYIFNIDYEGKVVAAKYGEGSPYQTHATYKQLNFVAKCIKILDDDNIGSPLEEVLQHFNVLNVASPVLTSVRLDDASRKYERNKPGIGVYRNVKKTLMMRLACSIRILLHGFYPPQGAMYDLPTVSALMKRATSLYDDYIDEVKQHIQPMVLSKKNPNGTPKEFLLQAYSVRRQDWIKACHIAVRLYFIPTADEAAFHAMFQTSQCRRVIAERTGQLMSFSGWIKFNVFNILDCETFAVRA